MSRIRRNTLPRSKSGAGSRKISSLGLPTQIFGNDTNGPVFLLLLVSSSPRLLVSRFGNVGLRTQVSDNARLSAEDGVMGKVMSSMSRFQSSILHCRSLQRRRFAHCSASWCLAFAAHIHRLLAKCWRDRALHIAQSTSVTAIDGADLHTGALVLDQWG